MNGPLSGIRVFDLTRVLAGPSCVQILGDLGAEVIKVEQPNVGDDTRKFGPPFLKDMDGNDTTESGYYMATNRNKRSLTLNLTSRKGQDIARQLISKSDILVENFKVGNLSKYNLSYDNLRDEYPSLIYCSITGFGQTGPLAEQPGYDFMAQGMGGLMSVTGPKDGEPHRVGVPIADLTAGLWATIGICAAVRHKEQTGEGQHLDISLLDTQVASLSIQGLNYLTSGDVPQLLGNAHPNIKEFIYKYNFKYKIKKIQKIDSFELKSINLRSYYNNNILAFGDLLHRIHPLAGQGFNMTIRDTKILLNIINDKKNLGLSLDSSVFAEFEKKLRHKNLIFANGIDLVYEFFNLERKLDNNFLIKSVHKLGNYPQINNFLIKVADKGFIN